MADVYEDTRNAGILHTFRHVNKEKRVGLTCCGMYVEFWPKHLSEQAPTCVHCLGYVVPACECPQFKKGLLVAGHRGYCPVVSSFAVVEERIEGIVRHCVLAKTHNIECDDDGFCQSCGYQLDDSNMQLLSEGPT